MLLNKTRACSYWLLCSSSHAVHRLNLWFGSPPPLGVDGLLTRYLIDFDEASVWLNKSRRKRGKAKRGEKAVVVQSYTRGLKVNLMLAVGNSGVIAYWIYHSNTTSEVRLFLCVSLCGFALICVVLVLQHVCEFFELFLFPKLGQRPHAVMMDNAQYHNTQVCCCFYLVSSLFVTILSFGLSGRSRHV